MIISDALEVGGWRMARRIQKPEKVDFKYPFKGPDNSKLFADVRRLEEGSKEEPVDFSCSCPHRPPSSSLGEIEKRDCRRRTRHPHLASHASNWQLDPMGSYQTRRSKFERQCFGTPCSRQAKAD